MNFGSANRTRPYTRFQRKLDTVREFPTVLEEFFDPFIKAAGHERNFEWSAVDRFYNDRTDTLSICYALKIFCEFVLKLFLQFNCEHGNLLIMITYLYERVQERCHGNSEAWFCQDCAQLQCRKQYHLNSRPLLREVAEKRERFYKDYKFHYPNPLSCRSPFPSYSNEDYTYYDYLRYNVKYGLIIIPNIEVIASLRLFQLRLDYYEFRTQQDRYVDSKDILFEFSMKNRNVRRLILIFDVMSRCTIIDGKYDNARNFRLISLTLSEPEISQKEVQELLNILFPDDEPFKNLVFSGFKEVFEDSPKLPSPRSLKHLCRCKIRDCLPRSPPMPTVLYQIELLPNYLKDYILILSN